MTVRELAERAGVSIATISLVLNNKPGVGEETKNLVLRLVEETGYVPKPPRAAPKSKAVGNIRFIRVRAAKGYLIDRNEEFMIRVLDGVVEAANAANRELIISNVEYEDFEATLLNINDDKDEGTILLATEMHQDMVAPALSKIQTPVVVLDNEMHQKNVDAVTMNSEQGAYLAANHLKELGHTRIGFIASKIPIASFVARERGLIQAASELGFVYDKRYRLELTPDLAHTNDILDAQMLEKPDFPTAFFAANDVLALTAMRLFKKLGKSIPDDYSIVGMDNLQISATSSPRLTTLKLPNETMGRMAVSRLLQKIENPGEAPMKTLVGCDLVVRKSTSPPKVQRQP